MNVCDCSRPLHAIVGIKLLTDVEFMIMLMCMHCRWERSYRGKLYDDIPLSLPGEIPEGEEPQ
jgi:hypothetical protein